MSMHIAPLGADRPLGVKQVADLPIVGSQPQQAQDGSSFANLLEGLGKSTATADGAVEDLATANERDLHDVVLAVETESMSFELAVQIRNHLVDAWNEIFRMSV